MVLVAAGLVAVVSSLPVTNALAERLPQWTLTRGDVERLGSTTFLIATVGLLMTCAGIALVYTAITGT